MTNQRLGLAVIAVADLVLGLVLIVGADARSSGLSFAVPKVIAPLSLWGLAVAVLGATILIALVLLDRLTPRTGRCTLGASCALAAGWHAFWAVSLTGSALTEPRAA